ncbi:MAG TPA: hypothetical protein PKE40_13135 [Arachnia sp.]|nr:hypothetical protein [Arachnia sp.]HMT87289.1 hypothetical protein [Arachnia sp.]
MSRGTPGVRARFRWRWFPSPEPSHDQGRGSASRSLEQALRRTALTLLVDWQAAMVVASAVTLGRDGWPLMAAHLGLLVYCLVASYAELRVLPIWFVPITMAVLGVCAMVLSGDVASALVFAAFWQLGFASLAAVICIRSRWTVPAVAVISAGLGVGLFLTFPAWGIRLPVSLALTQILMVIGVRWGVPRIRAIAEHADEQEENARHLLHRVEVERLVSAHLAEEARVLHDTVINTLAAITQGGAGSSDSTSIRQQCARDARVLAKLREKRFRIDDTRHLREIFAEQQIPVVRTGLSDLELDQVERRLDPPMIAGVVGAAQEALRNAAKHSGASSAEVSLLVNGDCLRVVVRDHGAGFDGKPLAGRGLANSVLGRAEQEGFEVTIVAFPGGGTTVELSVPLGAKPGTPVATPEDADLLISGIFQRSAAHWVLGVAALTLIQALSGAANESFALVPVILLLVGLRLWRAARSPAISAGLIAATVAVYLLTGAATAFGATGAIDWQALAASGPFAFLLARRPSGRLIGLGVALWGGVAVAAAVVSSGPTAIIALAAWVGISFCLFLLRFQLYLPRLFIETAESERAALNAKVKTDAAHLAHRTYRPWMDAGLDETVVLLNEIAVGARDVRDPETQRACDEKERYLRHLILVNPGLVRLSPRLIPALGFARDQGIVLTLDLGERDAADDVAAAAIAEAVLAVLCAARRGDRIRVSVYPSGEGLLLTVMGPGPALESLAGAPVRVSLIDGDDAAPAVAQMEFGPMA